jgi:hypothetical protein
LKNVRIENEWIPHLSLLMVCSGADV